MRTRRLAAFAALTIAVVGATPAAAFADTGTGGVIWVDGEVPCSNSGTGTAALPFCSLQIGIDAATAGDTVEFTGDDDSSVSVSVSGTATEPITIEAAPGRTAIIGVASSTTTTTPAFSISGASNVIIRGFQVTGYTPQFADITSSSDITLDEDGSGDYSWTPSEAEPFAEVAGSSSDVTISHSSIKAASSAPVIQIDAGSSDDAILGNIIAPIFGGDATSNEAALVSVAGAPGTVVTSNTITSYVTCAPAILLSGASTGSSIENNVLASTDSACDQLNVAATAVNGTTADYNLVYNSETGVAPYQWAGRSYDTAGEFYAASGQGAQDINANPQLDPYYALTSSSPAINAADSAAPGMLSTDLKGNGCTYDPFVAVTGAGEPAYCSRGAVQYQSPALKAATEITTLGALRVEASDQQNLADPQGYTYNWGDGQSSSTTTRDEDATHTYAKPGTYTITETVTDQLGGTASMSSSYTTEGTDYTPYGPVRLLDTRSALGGTQGPILSSYVVKLKIAGNGSIPADVSAVALNLTAVDGTGHGVVTAYADGSPTPSVSNLNYGAAAPVANEAIVPVGSDGYIDLYNSGIKPATGVDLIADVTGYFTATAASGFDETAPTRILDTRKGLGASEAKVGPKSSVALTIDGAGELPTSGITAVSVHVTAVDSTANGFVTVYPDGEKTPTASNLNYSTGSAISNTVIAPVGSDGKIDLYNGSPTGSVDLIADVTGYYTTTVGASTGVYVPVTPYRAVDTRKTTALSSHGSLSFWPTGVVNTPAKPGDAYVMNMTVVQPTGNGFITAYPAGESVPNTSSINYLSGQTVADLAQIGAGENPTGNVTVTNSEGSGTVEIIADVFGYYSHA